MNQTQFLEELKPFRGQFRLDDNCIHHKRLKSEPGGNWGACPLVVVCRAKTGKRFANYETVEARDALGIPERLRDYVVGAADNHSGYEAFRKKMLDVLGLEESK
jgi:hypothetical protein